MARPLRMCMLAVVLCTLAAAVSSVPQRVTPQLFGIPGLPPLTLRSDFNGIDPLNVRPDLAIAAGHTSVVLVRNNAVVIREKSGKLIASTDLFAFFSPVRPTNGGVGDPSVLYDPSADRFFVITESRSNGISYYLLAVSKTPSPADLRPNTWYFYSLNRSLDNNVVTSNWGDFDHMSVTDDALIITSSVYSFLDGSGQGIKTRIVDKSKVVRGDPVTNWRDLRDDALGRKLGRLMPATRTEFPSTEGVFLVTTTSACGFQIWRMTNLLSTPSLTTATVSDAPAGCSGSLDAVQPGGGQAIDVTGVGFNSQPVYRNGSLWIANNISKSFGGSPVTAIYVAEIDVSRWPDSVRTVQSSIIGENDVWQFAPAIMVDNSNNVGIVYARSSTTEFASAYYSGRLASDPPNTFRTGRPLKPGESVVAQIIGGRNRFTDYFGAALDPADNSIWMLGMYAKTPATSGDWVGNIDLRQQAMLESRERLRLIRH